MEDLSCEWLSVAGAGCGLWAEAAEKGAPAGAGVRQAGHLSFFLSFFLPSFLDF